jgi:outer membrane receptor protein involved in Fe transport
MLRMKSLASGSAAALVAAWASGVATAQAPAPAPADQSAATEDEASEEVVVTAQKRSQKIFEVPLPVQAVTKSQIENSGASGVADLVPLIPGASIVSKSTPGFETVQIRGISSGTTGDGLVGYYVDETPFGIPNLQLSPPARLVDVQRVEVIRGPSGTLYGQGSMGGTIKVVTATPDSTEFYGSARGEISVTDEAGTNYNTDLMLNIPLVENELALRIAGSFESVSGFADVPEQGLRDANDFEGANVRATAEWTPSEDLSLTLMYWHIDNHQDFNNGLTPGFPTSSPTITGTGGVAGYTDVKMDLYSATLEWTTPIGLLTSNSSYIDHKLDFEAPFTSLGFPFNNDSLFNTTSFTQEVRLASDNQSNFNWIAGVFYRDATIDNDICFYAFSCGIFPVINIVGPLKTESWSVFGEGTLSLLDGRLELLAGLRYFEDRRSGVTLNRTTLVLDSTSADYDSLSPRFNAKFNVTPNGFIYFNAAKGFRSGTLQTAAQAAASNALGVPTSAQVQPDELWTYELGTRWRLADGDLTVEASVYHTDWSDIQIQFATAAVVSIANAGDATIDGVDLGLAWRTPIDGLSLQFVAGLNQARFDRVEPALAAALPTIREGAVLPNVPRSNLTLAATYARQVEALGGLELSLYGAYSFRDNQIDATTGARSGELNDLTLRAGIAGEGWKVEAFGLNVLNDDDPSVITSTSVQILYPRRFGLSLNVEF